jgi:hypothetical protein
MTCPLCPHCKQTAEYEAARREGRSTEPTGEVGVAGGRYRELVKVVESDGPLEVSVLADVGETEWERGKREKS